MLLKVGRLLQTIFRGDRSRRSGRRTNGRLCGEALEPRALLSADIGLVPAVVCVDGDPSMQIEHVDVAETDHVANSHPQNGIIDVGDLPDGIIDVGDLPGGIIDVGDLPDGIIDVGDLPDGIIDVGDLPDGIIDVGDLPGGIIDVGDLPDGIIDVGDLPGAIIDVGDLPDGLHTH